MDDADIVGVERAKYEWGLDLIESYIADVKELPSAQPEIIHCGECRFREIRGVDGFCDHITGEPIMVKKTDHCSWAERRTDE